VTRSAPTRHTQRGVDLAFWTAGHLINLGVNAEASRKCAARDRPLAPNGPTVAGATPRAQRVGSRGVGPRKTWRGA
jgi:hypothetical protein